VSGGEAGAIQGTLAIMVGGKQEVFDDCEPIFKALGKNIVRVGDIWAGQTAKLVNQIIVALTLGALAETFTLGTKAGVDPARIFDAIRGGFAGSQVMKVRLPHVLEGEFKPGFKIRDQYKDIDNALAAARELGVPLLLTSIVHEMYFALKVAGKEGWDHAAIFQFIEKLAGIEVRKQK